jgi:hypothetical protein
LRLNSYGSEVRGVVGEEECIDAQQMALKTFEFFLLFVCFEDIFHALFPNRRDVFMIFWLNNIYSSLSTPESWRCYSSSRVCSAFSYKPPVHQ